MGRVVVNVQEAREATVTIVGRRELARIGRVSPVCNVLTRIKGQGVDRVRAVTRAMGYVVPDEVAVSSSRVIPVSRSTVFFDVDKRKLIHDWLVRSSTIRLVTGLKPTQNYNWHEQHKKNATVRRSTYI